MGNSCLGPKERAPPRAAGAKAVKGHCLDGAVLHSAFCPWVRVNSGILGDQRGISAAIKGEMWRDRSAKDALMELGHSTGERNLWHPVSAASKGGIANFGWITQCALCHLRESDWQFTAS